MKYNIVFKNHLLQAAASNSVRKNKQAKMTTIGTLPPPSQPWTCTKKQCYHPLTSHQPWEGLTSNTRENQCNFYCVGWCGWRERLHIGETNQLTKFGRYVFPFVIVFYKCVQFNKIC